MINKLSYYFFREALPSGLCNDIVRFGNSELNKVKGITGFEASIKKSVRKKLSKTDRRKDNFMITTKIILIIHLFHPILI